MSIITSKKSLSGIKLAHHKNTSEQKTISIEIPDEIVIPMLQHIGAPCEPIVKKGDKVKVGQKIGESEAFVSSPIFASCSGEVTNISDFRTPFSALCKAVTIKTDKLQQIDESIKTPTVNNKADFISAIKNSGLVGLGGAGFPSFIKLDYKKIENVTTLVINAAECEPYITADNRECIENTQNIVDGILAVQKYLGIPQVYIGIEQNKPEAIDVLANAVKSHPSIKIVKLKTIYPQGAEKSIIYACCGVVVKQGELPADSGVIVLNVSSVGFIGQYLKDGIPLTQKRLTVDGDCVENPKNLLVPIGTKISDITKLIDFNADFVKILMGGPMMGVPLINQDFPIIKNNNAVLYLSQKTAKIPKTTACIRCGKCVGVCPMKLMPAGLERAYEAKNKSLLKELAVDLCINCGCCSYICPAKRHLAQKNQLAKQIIKEK